MTRSGPAFATWSCLVWLVAVSAVPVAVRAGAGREEPARVVAPDSAAADTLRHESAFAVPADIAAADSLARRENGEELTAERLKELLRRETGEPEIEGSLWRRRKNPRVAMLCALTFPGLGQVYNEKPLKAIVAMGVETFYLLNILHWYRRERREQVLRDSYEKYVPCGPEGLNRCLNSRWNFHNAWMEEYKARKIDWVWWSSAAVLAVMIDAYVDAHLHDMRFRIESAPGEGAGLAVVVDF